MQSQESFSLCFKIHRKVAAAPSSLPCQSARIFTFSLYLNALTTLHLKSTLHSLTMKMVFYVYYYWNILFCTRSRLASLCGYSFFYSYFEKHLTRKQLHLSTRVEHILKCSRAFSLFYHKSFFLFRCNLSTSLHDRGFFNSLR